MVDFEAEKQALGCDTSSCLSEIAGALGAGYVVFGRVGRLDDVYLLQLNLFDSAKGRAVAREEARSDKLSVLSEQLRPLARRLVSPLTGETPVYENTGAADGDGGSLFLPLVLAGGGTAAVGLGLVVAGAVGAAVSEGTLASTTESRQAKSDALLWGPISFVGAGVGAVVLLAGVGVAGAAFVVE
jgi:hypothetical protein